MTLEEYNLQMKLVTIMIDQEIPGSYGYITALKVRDQIIDTRLQSALQELNEVILTA